MRSRARQPSLEQALRTCKALSDLPSELKGRIIGSVLAEITIDLSNIKTFGRYFKYVPYSEVEIIIDARGKLSIKSFYTKDVNLILDDTKDVPMFLTEVTIKQVVFSTPAIKNFISLATLSEEVIFLYQAGSKCLPEALNVLTSIRVTQIRSTMNNTLPPFLLVERCKDLESYTLPISTGFKDVDSLQRLASLAKRLILEISVITNESYYNSSIFKQLLELDCTDVRLLEAIAPKDYKIINLIKKLEIEHLKISTGFDNLRVFENVSLVTLESNPPSRYKLTNRSLKALNCAPEKKSGKINFSFKRLTQVLHLFIRAPITKHSFETIQDTVRFLTLDFKGFDLNISSFKLPARLVEFHASHTSIDKLSTLESCRCLRVLILEDVVDPENDSCANDVFWKNVPATVRLLKLDFNERYPWGMEQRYILKPKINDKIKELVISVKNSMAITMATRQKHQELPFLIPGPFGAIHISNISDKVKVLIGKPYVGVFVKNEEVENIKVVTLSGIPVYRTNKGSYSVFTTTDPFDNQ